MADIQIREFEKVIMDALEDYGEEAEKAIAVTLPLIGKETVEEIRANGEAVGIGGSGNYLKGWKYQMNPRRKKKHENQMVVYNKTHYRLAHLLEKGHAKVNGGRTRAFPHILKAQNSAEKKVVERLKQKLEQIRV